MPLSPDQLPLPRSVRDRVMELFAQDSPRGAAETAAHSDIVEYLAKSIDTDSSPLTTIRRRAAKAGRPSNLAPEDHATLVWISEAFSDWEEMYALESPLREHVHKLLPLAVAVALDDDSFFEVGSHPLHKLIDALQRGAVGWQARLDRAGQMLEQRVERSVEKALEWFDNRAVNFRAITNELEAANDRDDARAERMVQRLEETESARLKTLHARRRAASQINECLEEFELPAAIGDFLKGAWFESAQMVILKHGEDSREWRDMLRATRNLMESVQPSDVNDEDAKESRKQLLRRLPGELRRWMLSLEHDSDAIDGAIGLVEYAHLRMQHGQNLDMSFIEPLPDGDSNGSTGLSAEPLETGQWYHFDEGDLRAQLVLQMDNGDHLLFSNFVGLKAMELTEQGFRKRLESGTVRTLPSTGTFSLSLATAAGIYSDDSLRALIDPNYQPAPTPTSTPAEPAPYAEPEADVPPDASGAAHETPAPEAPTSSDYAEPEPAPSPAPTYDPPPAPVAPAYQPPEPPPYQTPPAPPPPAYQTPPAPEPPPAPPAYQAPPPAPEPPQAPAAPPPQQVPQPPPAPTAPPTAPVDSGKDEEPDAQKTEVDIPMGAWLGFHDGDTPMMAKLAVYDPRRDNYILVNRKGIALRELSGADLVRLMNAGMVDILETRSHFRDEVQRAREEDQ